MEPFKMATEFAPAERVSDGEIERQRRLFEDVPLMDQLLDAVPSCLVVLNRQRQLVYANQSLYRALDTGSEGFRVLGSRPGEILKCDWCAGPGHGRIMMHDQFTARRASDIALDRVGAHSNRQLEGLERVLMGLLRGTPMGNHQRSGWSLH